MKGGQTFPITNISYEDTNKYKSKADEGIDIKRKTNTNTNTNGQHLMCGLWILWPRIMKGGQTSPNISNIHLLFVKRVIKHNDIRSLPYP